MSKKKPLNLSVSAELLDQFNEVCGHYGHAKQKGMVLSSAILMFIEADPQTQGKYLKRIATAQIESGVEEMIQRTQVALGKALAGDLGAAPKSRKAAKRAGAAVRAVKKLPTLGDLGKAARKS